MQVLIDIGPNTARNYQDYTRYVVAQSLVIEDSLNVPTLINFTLVNNNDAFVPPPQGAYVKIVSNRWAASGGYLPPGADAAAAGKILATGFITNVPERDFLGMAGSVPSFNFQNYAYNINATSDEWILNTKVLPFLPAFVNQTQGQILASLATAMAPEMGFDTTSFIASGDLVPYYQYNPEQSWADVAKTFADASRYRYKVIDKKIYFQPFGDQPFGISYDDTISKTNNPGGFSPPDLRTAVLTVPPVNDCTVIGDIEPQNNVDCYFVGDGFTAQFKLAHSMFRGASAQLLSDDWTESSFNTSYWRVQDPLNIFDLAGSLNVNQLGAPTALGQEYIVGINGIELGGGLNLQHGEFLFTNTNDGLLGGVYTDANNLTQANCFAGFIVSPSGTLVPSTSGYGGIIIQPLYNGLAVGPQVVTQPNHHYFLQTIIGGRRWDRYERVYRNLANTQQYGGNALASFGEITWLIQDIDLALLQQNAQQNPLLTGAGVTAVTTYMVSGANIPEFGVYAPINAANLNLTLNYTLLAQPPQGSLFVQGLSGVAGFAVGAFSGGKLPILPSQLSAPQQYLMGFGFQNQVATIITNGDSQYLAFYTDTIPAVGARIRFQSWAAGQSISRVQSAASIAQQAVISGDNGIRGAIITSIKPLPRTSSECELAAAAAILDRSMPQYQGSYGVVSIPRTWTQMFDGSQIVVAATGGNVPQDFPRSGRYFPINSVVRGITGQSFLIHTVRTQLAEMYDEVYGFTIEYGPDLYLEKLLPKFLERPEKILTPTETIPAPNPLDITQAGQFYLNVPNDTQITAVVNSLTGNYVVVDLGAPPVTGCEVRRVDAGWGTNDSNLIGRFTTRQFNLSRTIRDQTWYVRFINGPFYSRFSKQLRVAQPLVPSPPIVAASNSQRVTFQFNGDVRDIYGVELRVGGSIGSVTVPLTYTPPLSPADNFVGVTRLNFVGVPPPQANVFGWVTSSAPAFQVGDVILTNVPVDASFNGLQVITEVVPTTPGFRGLITWIDHGKPYPVSYGSSRGTSPLGTVRLYLRDATHTATLSSYSRSAGSYVTTFNTTGNHNLSTGDVVILGAMDTSNPFASDTATIAGTFTVLSTPTTTSFTVDISTESAPLPATTSMSGNLYGQVTRLPSGSSVFTFGTPNQQLLARRVIASESDLTFDLTQPDIAEALAIVQSFSSSGGRISDLKGYFFNLTWDYSDGTLVPTFIAPSISGLVVDDVSQQLTWGISQGRPTGYRVQVQDTTGATTNKFTVDNPTNPQVLTSFQMSAVDFYNDRTITITPFDGQGDGIPSTIVHLGGAGASGIPNTASYSIGSMWNGTLPISTVLARVPLEQQVTFPPDFAGSTFCCDLPFAASGVFTITRNGILVGTITVAPGKTGATAATFSSGGVPLTFNVRDILRVYSPTVADSVGGDIGFVLLATKAITIVNPNVQLTLNLSDSLNNWADVLAKTLA